MGDGKRVTRETAPIMGADAKAEMRRWVDRWKVVGPLLEADRWARLLANSDDELRQQSQELLLLWRPEIAGDDGEALLLQQRIFARLGARELA